MRIYKQAVVDVLRRAKHKVLVEKKTDPAVKAVLTPVEILRLRQRG